MRILYRTAAALLILGIALLSITLARQRSDASPAAASSNPPPAQQNEVPRWEYKVVSAKSSEGLLVQANQDGTASWELVSAVHVTDSNLKWVGFFKRQTH